MSVIPAKAGIQVLNIIPAQRGFLFLDNLFIQIPPIGILLLDEPQLPTTAPFLQLFFALDGRFSGFAGLVVNELIDAIPRGESGDFLLFVLPDAAR
jgi:hypothetical protein